MIAAASAAAENSGEPYGNSITPSASRDLTVTLCEAATAVIEQVPVINTILKIDGERLSGAKEVIPGK